MMHMHMPMMQDSFVYKRLALKEVASNYAHAVVLMWSSPVYKRHTRPISAISLGLTPVHSRAMDACQ